MTEGGQMLSALRTVFDIHGNVLAFVFLVFSVSILIGSLGRRSQSRIGKAVFGLADIVAWLSLMAFMAWILGSAVFWPISWMISKFAH